jgi:glycerol-3-phosphate dehydrogenase (NAD(P)+)
MLTYFRNIVFVGSGAIATALGNILAMNEELDVTILSIEPDVVENINQNHINKKYFPSIQLRPGLVATLDNIVLKKAHIVFMAIPSADTVNYIRKNRSTINPEAIIVNLAKGFGEKKKTIVESLNKLVSNPVCSLKGPSFARDILNDQPTGFTLASKDEAIYHIFEEVFEGTNIKLDHSTDVNSVEVLSILKNIYAIVMGIVDAQFDSPNLRFLILTRAFKEMREILLLLGGNEQTMFKYCGYGDFSLTALNDLSRNRTLGLLIGKGFFVKDISDKVVLEGKNAVSIICERIAQSESPNRYPIIFEVFEVFREDYDVSKFTQRILEPEEGEAVW